MDNRFWLPFWNIYCADICTIWVEWFIRKSNQTIAIIFGAKRNGDRIEIRDNRELWKRRQKISVTYPKYINLFLRWSLKQWAYRAARLLYILTRGILIRKSRIPNFRENVTGFRTRKWNHILMIGNLESIKSIWYWIQFCHFLVDRWLLFNYYSIVNSTINMWMNIKLNEILWFVIS